MRGMSTPRVLDEARLHRTVRYIAGTLGVEEVGRETCVAISSGECEFHALTFCAARLIFTKNLVEGFGFPPVDGPIAYSDSSAARGVANRKGVGELKHLQVRSLWLQQARVDGQVKVDRVDTFGRGTTETVDWNATSARTGEKV